MIREALAFSLGVLGEWFSTRWTKLCARFWMWIYEIRDWIEGTYW